jgi:hypothetical protein
VLNSNDIANLEALAKREHFNRVKEVRFSSEEMTVYFYRELHESAFDSLYYRSIELRFIYTKREGSSIDVSLTEIEILNTWAGYRQPLKEEIDRIVELFSSLLKERIGADHVRIERTRTGPPL